MRNFLYICVMEKQIYKVGSYLYCIKPVVMKNGKNQGKNVTKLNKNYQIVSIAHDRFYIVDEIKTSHSFDFQGYVEWFIYTDKKIKDLDKFVDEIINGDVF